MKAQQRQFHVSLVREGKWVVAQCLDVDVASQGRTELEAVRNLKEALILHFQIPVATDASKLLGVRALIAS